MLLYFSIICLAEELAGYFNKLSRAQRLDITKIICVVAEGV